MADLFGFGTQKPAPENPWEKSMRREREISPIVEMLNQAGNQQEAALVKADIDPKEKSMIMKMISQGKADENIQSLFTAKAPTTQEELENRVSELSFAISNIAMDNPQKANSLMRLLQQNQKGWEANVKDNKIKASAKDFYKRYRQALEEAGGASGNLREALSFSDDPKVAEVRAAQTGLIGFITQGEGGYKMSKEQIQQVSKDLGHNIGKLAGTDKNTLAAAARGALVSAGFGDIADEVDQEMLANEDSRLASMSPRTANMEATPTPRGGIESLGSKLQKAGVPLGSSTISDAAVNLILDTANIIPSAARAIAPETPQVPRLEASAASDALEMAMQIGSSILVAGAIFGPGGAAIATGIGIARGISGYGAAKAGSAIAGKAYDTIAGKPQTEREANRKEGIQTIGSLVMGAPVAAKFDQGLNAVRTLRANTATGKFTPWGGSKPSEKPAVQRSPSKPTNGNPPTAAMQPEASKAVSPSAQGLEAISRSAQASSAMVAPLRNNISLNGRQTKEIADGVSLSADLAVQNLGRIASDVAKSHGEPSVPHVQMLGDMKASIESGIKMVEESGRAYTSTREMADNVPAIDEERWLSLTREAYREEVRYNNLIQNLSKRLEAISSQAEALVGVATAQPETSISSMEMKNRLQRAIDTGLPIEEYYPIAAQVVADAQRAPVYINRFADSDGTLRQQHNMAVAAWQKETAQRKAEADDKYRKELLTESRKAFDEKKKEVEVRNSKIEEKNLQELRNVLQTALPMAKGIPSMADSAIRVAEELDKARKAASEPLGKEFEAINKALAKKVIKPESVGKMLASVKEANDEAKALFESDTTDKLRKIFAELEKSIESKARITLKDLAEAISQIGEFINFNKFQGHSTNKMKSALKVMGEAFEESAQALIDSSKPQSAAALKKLLARRKAVNEQYAALKETFDNPEIGKLRGRGGESKEPSLKVLLGNAEGLAKLGKALGSGSTYQSLLALKLFEELKDPVRLGDSERIDKVINYMDTREVMTLPDGVADTLRSMEFDRPSPVGEYRPPNVSAASAPVEDWFDPKRVPKQVNVADMTPEQIWGMLDTPTGVARVKASTQDNEARKALFREKAAEVLGSGRGSKVEAGWNFKKLAKIVGVGKGLTDTGAEPISRWFKAIKDPEKAQLVKALVGEKEFDAIKKDIEKLGSIADAIISGRQASLATAAAVIPSLIASPFYAMMSAPAAALAALAIVGHFKERRATAKLRGEGIETKKKKTGKP